MSVEMLWALPIFTTKRMRDKPIDLSMVYD